MPRSGLQQQADAKKLTGPARAQFVKDCRGGKSPEAAARTPVHGAVVQTLGGQLDHHFETRVVALQLQPSAVQAGNGATRLRPRPLPSCLASARAHERLHGAHPVLGGDARTVVADSEPYAITQALHGDSMRPPTGTYFSPFSMRLVSSCASN